MDDSKNRASIVPNPGTTTGAGINPSAGNINDNKNIGGFQGEAPVCVVGIGASAGGLEAISELLRKLPDSTGMAFVIIQHLSPDYKSMLSEILCKYTMMPVIQAEDGIRLEKNTVYLIPPKYNMEVRQGTLVLHEYVHTRVVNHPVDIFLRSLANEYESKAVAVILSGTGSDGTNGIRRVKENGGMIIVQRPESAKFDGMPRSALQTGFADMSLGPQAIAEELTHIAVSMSSGTVGMSDEELLNKIYSILKKVSNVNYTYYKKTTIARRIERRMVVNHVENLYEYVDMLRTNNEEAASLAKDVLIGVTGFFRDPECFEALKEKVVKPLVSSDESGKPIRVWVTGCSTGEEAYSVGILFSEAMEELECKRPVKIFATDLDKEAILAASKGLYGENIIEDVSAQRLSHYFIKRNNQYMVSRELRKMIVFAPQNVFQDPPFGKLDLICCRNMMIYFQPVLQKDLFAIFHTALNDNGYLFLGRSETVSGFGDIFNTISANEKIYIHNASGQAPSDVHLRYHVPPIDGDFINQDQQKQDADRAQDDGELKLRVLEEYMPPCILVDEKNVIRHTFGDCKNFMHFPHGKAEYDLFGSITDDLKISVSTALKSVRDRGERVTLDDIRIHGESEETIIAMTVAPIDNRFGEVSEYVALVFMQKGSDQIPDGAVKYDINQAASQRISDLEKELVQSQGDLKNTVSELETVNEELQAANEELLTANEELQSSNEELQSVNEELYTVNSEYQEKLNEVTSLNNDISNFLASTLVGVIFLDEKLQIRRFTNYISQEFNIMDQDIGRPLRFMAYNFINVDIMEISSMVLTRLVPVEQMVVTASGKSYFMRVSPYRTQDNKILGLVITFVDTTPKDVDSKDMNEIRSELEEAQRANREKDSFLSRMSHDMRTPLNVIMGASELLIAGGDLDPELERKIKIIRDNGAYLRGVINDILETSQINAGKMEIFPIPTVETEFLNSIVPLLGDSAEMKSITLTSRFNGASSRSLLMDGNHMLQVLVNIISNAIKFTGEGGKIDFVVNISTLDNGKVRHEYIISDTGCGMSESFMSRMFEPFEQESPYRTGINGGTGLGLFIVRKIIDAMNGTIKCESAIGLGTTFTVDVEYAVAGESVDASESVTEEEERMIMAGKRVLICEDQSINAAIAAEMLKRIGIVPEIAENGREAVEKYENHQAGYYSAILMDIRMPEMNGREATVAIRSKNREDSKSIPVIAMTADTFSNDRDGCISAGMNDCIYKPIEMQSMYAILYKYLK